MSDSQQQQQQQQDPISPDWEEAHKLAEAHQQQEEEELSMQSKADDEAARLKAERLEYVKARLDEVCARHPPHFTAPLLDPRPAEAEADPQLDKLIEAHREHARKVADMKRTMLTGDLKQDIDAMRIILEDHGIWVCDAVGYIKMKNLLFNKDDEGNIGVLFYYAPEANKALQRVYNKDLQYMVDLLMTSRGFKPMSPTIWQPHLPTYWQSWKDDAM